MTKLSVNINKIATLRNARGGNTPSVLQAANLCQDFGADGITIHPRQDERHITRKDVYDIKSVINHADYLIVLWDSSVLKGGGTHGEVTLAYWTGKPIFLVNKIPADDFSAWISSCSSKIYGSFDELKIDLLSQYKLEE